MKKEKLPLVIGGLIIILLGFLIVWHSGIIGVSKSRLEQDARENQKISGSWQMTQAVSDNMCAMLFYDETQSDCRYSIYLTHEGVSYGYFYSEGGADSLMLDRARGMIYEGKGIALLSLNKERVCRIEVTKDASVEYIPIDPGKPFAVVLPSGCGEITMYDAQGNMVKLLDTYAG